MSEPEKNLDYEQTASVTDVHASVRREKEDPQTGLEPATIKVFAVCAIFLMIGGVYLGAHGRFDGSSVLPGYTPVDPAPDGKGPKVLSQIDQWFADGKETLRDYLCQLPPDERKRAIWKVSTPCGIRMGKRGNRAASVTYSPRPRRADLGQGDYLPRIRLCDAATQKCAFL